MSRCLYLVGAFALGAALLSVAGRAADGVLPDHAPTVIEDWAPGTLNPAEGTIEMDVRLLRDRAEMTSDWQFLFQAVGNAIGPVAGNTTLGLVFCPPGDARDFLGLARGARKAAYATSASPAFHRGDRVRVALTWGQDRLRVFWQGRKVAEAAWSGPLATLPARFRAGSWDYFAVDALRISSRELEAATLAASGPLVATPDATLLVAEGKKAELPASPWQRATTAAALFPVRHDFKPVTICGEPAVMPLRGVNRSERPVQFRLEIEVRDRSGRLRASRSETRTLAPGTVYQPDALSLPPLADTGIYTALVRIGTEAGPTEVHPITFFVQAPDAAPAGKLADFLGHHHALDAMPAAYTALGVRWHRAWASDRAFLWCNLEPSPGEFLWAGADRSVAQAERLGLKTVAVLGYPPTWASTYSATEVARVGVRSVPEYAQRPDRYQPRSLDEWRRYVTAVVGRYRGRIQQWEVYNEVDFHPPFLHATFSGSTQDYAALLRVTKEVVTQLDPSALVLTAGFSLLRGVNDVDMPRDLLALGAARDFDALAVHGYTDEATLAQVVRAVRAAKPNVPLWQTERQYMGGPRDEYQVVHGMFWCLANGFAHFFLHAADLDRRFGEQEVTPYYAVTAEVARQLRPADRLLGPVPGPSDDAIDTWLLQRTDGRFLHVLAATGGTVAVTWDRSGGPATATLTNLYGETLATGPLPETPWAFQDIVYVVASRPLRIAAAKRLGNDALINGDFEVRSGDFLIDPAAARPAFWQLRPEAMASKVQVISGGTGQFALRFGPVKSPGAWLAQRVTLTAGAWTLAGKVRLPAGSRAELVMTLLTEGRAPAATDTLALVGTGDWQPVSVLRAVGAPGRREVRIGVIQSDGPVTFDDLSLVPETSLSAP